MIMILIIPEILHVLIQVCGAKLSLMPFDGKNLVSCKLNRSRFMAVYMACVGRYDAFISV